MTGNLLRRLGGWSFRALFQWQNTIIKSSSVFCSRFENYKILGNFRVIRKKLDHSPFPMFFNKTFASFSFPGSFLASTLLSSFLVEWTQNSNFETFFEISILRIYKLSLNADLRNQTRGWPPLFWKFIWCRILQFIKR